MAGCCHLPDENGESGEDGVVSGARGVELEQAVQVAAEQVELCGLEMLRGFHGAPDLLGDLEQQLDLGSHAVEFLGWRLRLEGERRANKSMAPFIRV